MLNSGLKQTNRLHTTVIYIQTRIPWANADENDPLKIAYHKFLFRTSAISFFGTLQRLSLFECFHHRHLCPHTGMSTEDSYSLVFISVASIFGTVFIWTVFLYRFRHLRPLRSLKQQIMTSGRRPHKDTVIAGGSKAQIFGIMVSMTNEDRWVNPTVTNWGICQYCYYDVSNRRAVFSWLAVELLWTAECRCLCI